MTQPLPNVADLERALLGRVLLQPELAASLDLSPAAFYVPSHRTIWKAIADAQNDGTPTDLPALRVRIDNGDEQDSIGPTLAKLVDEAGPATSLPFYRDQILEASRRREAIRNLAAASEEAAAGRPLDGLIAILDLLRDGLEARHEGKLDAFSPAEAMTAEPAEIPWIVRGWLAEAELCLLCGEWGTGKSWLSLDLAVAIAAGRAWVGHAPIAVSPRRVLYVDEENGPRMARHRLRQMLLGAGITNPADLPIRYLSRNGIVLDQPAGFAALEAEVKTFKPEVVILDSLVRFHGADENSASEMAQFFARCIRPLTGRYGCAVVALDHLRKPNRNEHGAHGHRIRGSSDKAGVADEIWLLEGDRKTRDRTIRHEKTRWDEPMPDLAITWEKSEDGQAVTITGRLAEVSGEDRAIAHLSNMGPDGDTHGEIVRAVMLGGVSDRTAKHTIRRLHERGALRQMRQGRSVRYWLTEYAPVEAG